MKQRSFPKFDMSSYRNTSLFNFDNIEDDSDDDNDLLENDSDG